MKKTTKRILACLLCVMMVIGTFQLYAFADGKNGLSFDDDGEVRFYEDGKAIYKGLVKYDGNYYYINSAKKAVKNTSYGITTAKANGLLPTGLYTFDADGKMVLDSIIKPAVVTAIGDEALEKINASGDIVGYVSGDPAQLDTAVVFKAADNRTNTERFGTGDWRVDFDLSFNKDVTGDQVVLFGNYGEYGWVGDKLSTAGINSLAAGDSIKVIADWFAAYYGAGFNPEISYNEVIDLREFTAAIGVDDVAPITATLKLVVTDPSDGSAYVLGTYTYVIEDTAPVVVKDGLCFDEDGEIRFYDYGKPVYAGLIQDEAGNYYYINSTKKAVKSCSYGITTAKANGLLPTGLYKFGADGRMILDPVIQPANITVLADEDLVIDNDVTLDTAVAFEAVDTEAETAKYNTGDWTVDFELSFDRAIDGSKVAIYGNYGEYGWIGDTLAAGGINSLAAGSKVAIMGDWFANLLGATYGTTPLTYDDVIALGQFICGIKADGYNGMTATLDLVITNPETGAKVNAGTYTYTIDNAPVINPAVVTEIEVDDDEIVVDTAVSFAAVDTDDFAIAEGTDDWTADFELSFDQAIDGSKVTVYGNYGDYGWIGDTLAAGGINSLAADQKVAIMGDWFANLFGATYGTTPLTYLDIIGIGEFNCAIAVDGYAGVTATLDLVLTDPDTGDRVIAGTYTYVIEEDSPVTPAIVTPLVIENALETVSGDEVVLDTAVAFTAADTINDAVENGTSDWVVDFLLSFDQDVDTSKIVLFGNYGDYGWIGDTLEYGGIDTLEAGQTVKVMEDWLSGAMARDVSVTYDEVIGIDTFSCGLAADGYEGVTATLQLILTNPADGTTVVAGTYTYVLG